MAKKKYVYDFEEAGVFKDPEERRRYLGGKGKGLAEMTLAGLPVPPGFTITTEACRAYYTEGEKIVDELWPEVLEHLKRLEEKTGKKFGDPDKPLLVSVRSGAPVSMPGMMDTILNVGLNDEVVKGLAKLTNNERFAYDAYRRLIQMFGTIVMGIDKKKFDEVFEKIKEKYGAKTDAELDANAMKEVVEKFKEVYKKEAGEEFPQDPLIQLKKAIKRVFESWNNPRAIKYRELFGIPHDLCTAVNVVMMVFGNMGDDSGTGVAFTRNPSTGEKELYGEFLPNAQGEDVVAGIRTPLKIEELKNRLPEVYNQLVEVAKKLEKYYRDMQDIEFTVEKGKLYLLQTRRGKRTALAAVKIAVDMAKEGLITKEEAIMRVTPEQLQQLLHRRIDPEAKEKAKKEGRLVTVGLNASPGAAVGKVVFTSEEAEEHAKKGEKVILVRPETTPEDVGGMAAAQGILTARGGMTSHAAVVARAMGKPAVVGAEELDIDEENKIVRVRGKDITFKEGDIITIDGTTGEVFLGELPTIEPELPPEAHELLKWADEFRKLGVRANADNPEAAKRALEFGAEGIGLARTERMFQGKERIQILRKFILAETKEDRRKIIEELIPMQKGDFKAILEIFDGKPVIFRLLDPPLHEFLPSLEELLPEYYKAKYESAKEKLEELETMIKKVKAMMNFNPMIGFRGTRVGIMYPELYEAQTKAAAMAAAELIKEGKHPVLKIMLPNVSNYKELEVLKPRLEKVIEEVAKEYGVELKVDIGTMIEIPRAALTADELAKYAVFFSYGTNDLTQATLAMSRDDAERFFIHEYIKRGILEKNPFQTLDKAVAELIKIGVERGRKTRPDLEVGICGEHGGDPESIEICHKIGLNYVSASPFRIPIARLAAAQAAIKEKWEKEGKKV